MSQDWIPAADADFNSFLHNFLTYANANLAAFGLTAPDLAPLTTAVDFWNTTYPKHVSAQAAARGAKQDKDQARQDVEAQLRPLSAGLQAKTSVADKDRESLGLPVRSTARTPVGAPTTRPVVQVDTSQRLQHVIAFVDELTPGSRAKPDGVMGCEVWSKIGGATPADPNELTYLATDTRTPYTAVFAGADAGKTAYYMLRWVSTRGERGPWSQTVAATVTN